ncbi:MAG TPA: M28 family peptidase [Pirellulales bacterium]|nr:M28 family peptidase [Pirellulales bacterium]
MSKARVSGQRIYFAVVLTGSCLLAGYLAWPEALGLLRREAQAGPRRRLDDIPFDGQQAFDDLRRLCDLGPRYSGSEGMERQQELLAEHFEACGAEVERQAFRVRHPLNGKAVPMTNLIAHWHPERKERILLCAHYDTRPFPDKDLRRPKGTFVGANDGASGTALLMQLARGLGDLEGKLGVDIVLFDGEELVFGNVGEYFQGSTHFAREYVADGSQPRYRWAVLLDMIGDGDLQIKQEINSMSWRDTRPLVESIWATAKRLGVREFIARRGHEVSDDHLPLHDIAKIPACDIIDLDYPHWHTEGDTPEHCSALSLAKVGWVLQEWLASAVQ